MLPHVFNFKPSKKSDYSLYDKQTSNNIFYRLRFAFKQIPRSTSILGRKDDKSDTCAATSIWSGERYHSSGALHFHTIPIMTYHNFTRKCTTFSHSFIAINKR